MSSSQNENFVDNLVGKKVGFYDRHPVGTVLEHPMRNGNKIRSTVVSGRKRASTLIRHRDSNGFEIGIGIIPRPKGNSFVRHLGATENSPAVACYFPYQSSKLR